MPQAVLHILVPLVLVALFKDVYEKRNGKGSFPLHYVLIAGLAGLIPDLDVVVFWFLHASGIEYNVVHRTIAHSLLVPFLFVGAGFLTRNIHIHEIRKHKLKTSVIFYLCAFGCVIHLVLDSMFGGVILPFLPFATVSFSMNIVQFFPDALRKIVVPSLEAALLVLWLVWLELKHKVSDFV